MSVWKVKGFIYSHYLEEILENNKTHSLECVMASRLVKTKVKPRKAKHENWGLCCLCDVTKKGICLINGSVNKQLCSIVSCSVLTTSSNSGRGTINKLTHFLCHTAAFIGLWPSVVLTREVLNASAQPSTDCLNEISCVSQTSAYCTVYNNVMLSNAVWET